MKLRLLLLAALVFAACGRELPSSTPLGGKLDDGISEGYTPDRRPRTDAGEVTEVAEEKEEVDAGVADAGSAKAELADAGAGDAAVEAGSDSAARWAGEYLGSDVTTTRLGGRPELRQPDDKARTRVEEKGSGRIALVIVNSLSGDVICTLKAATQGARATIDADQDCFGTEVADVTVKSGSAEIRGDRLTFDLRATVEGVVGDEKVEGTIDYRFEGKRQ